MVPFEEIIEKLSVQRDLSHSPVYQVIFQSKIPEVQLLSLLIAN